MGIRGDNNRKKPGVHYLRYLLSFIIVFLIPVLSLSVFYSARFLRQFHAEVCETVDLELQQLGVQVSHEEAMMQSIGNQIILSKAFRKASAYRSPLDYQPLIELLAGYMESNLFLDGMFIVFDDGSYVVTDSTTCARTYFFAQLFRSGDHDSGQLYGMLKKATVPALLPSMRISSVFLGPSDDYLLYVFPLYTDYQKHKGSLVFCIEKDHLRELMSAKLSAYDAHIFAKDGQGETIFTLGDDGTIPFASFPGIGSVDAKGMLRIGDKQYLLRQSLSKGDGLSYYALIPKGAPPLAVIASITHDYFILLVIVIVISCLVIALLQRFNYRPMKMLRDKADLISPGAKSINELQTISHALDYLKEKNNNLATQVEKGANAIKNERLLSLFSGRYNSREDFNMDCSEIGLFFPFDNFFVTLLYAEGVVDSDILGLVAKKILSSSLVCYYLAGYEQGLVVLIQNTPKNSLEYGNLYRPVQTMLQKEFPVLLTFAVGSVEQGLEKLAVSYMNARDALNNRQLNGEGSIIDSRSLLEKQQYIAYPSKEFERLKNALSLHDKNTVAQAIEDIILIIDAGAVSVMQVRSICADLSHMLDDCSPQTGNAEKLPSPMQFPDKSALPDIVCQLRAWKEAFISRYTEVTQEKYSLLQINAYLGANCLRGSFSILEAAEHFEMSLSSFSRYYKDRAGQNVMDYVIAERMREAKRLLAESDLLLKDIAEKVGYYNVSSFLRRFKIMEGITPNDYRKMLHEGLQQ